MKLIFFDFEVFYKDWMVVFIEHTTKEKTIIINDSQRLKEFYENNKENIFCGYNSRMYDQFILKGVLSGLDPYFVNNQIINEEKSGYQVVKNHDDYPFNNFDVSTGFHSLKQLEGFMGSRIKETSIPFDINRKLTDSELEEVVLYCTHDVEQTIEVFNNRKEEFDSQLSLIEAFKLPMSMFNKTKAQLSAHILGAERNAIYDDEFEITIPDTLKISNKYQYVVDWYKDEKNRNYKKCLNTNVAGVPHTFAWGGVHGAKDNYSTEGIILCCDVASLYPSIMIEYGYLSRNVNELQKYREIRDTRLRLKAEKNPMQAPMKIVLNATYGCMKDKHNDLYDPLMANNVCITGQLLLLDLIEKIEPYCELIQSNTDGLFLKVDNAETIEGIKFIAKEWEQRTRLTLEWDIYNKIYQKDVNNYIIINEKGKSKSKGAYVKKLNNIDYDLPIVNKGLINYFTSNKSIEDTINECNDLREYQKIVKVSSLYKYAIYGDKKLPEKVLRVFASKNENACGVFKVKSENKIEKIANTPERCFVYNDNVNGVKIPKELDKQYYIDIAKKRLSDFMNPKVSKSGKTASDIKFVNKYTKQDVINFIDNSNYDNFIDLLINLTESVNITCKQMEILIKLNFFSQFGGNVKLLNIYKEFLEGDCRYNKKHKEETKQKRIPMLKLIEEQTPDEQLSIREQLNFEKEVLGFIQSTYDYHKDYVYIAGLVTGEYSPKVEGYCLANGKKSSLKVKKIVYEDKPFVVGDIIKVTKYKPREKSKKSETSVSGWESIPGTKEWWIESYIVTNLT